MGRERAHTWRSNHADLPAKIGPVTIAEYTDATVSADLLGVRDSALREKIRRASRSFGARDFLGFDPAVEPPPADLPHICRCGLQNQRGRRTCRACKRRLRMRSRYQTWMNALYRGYRSDRSGVPAGAKFADAIAWLPEMRPYCEPDNDGEEDFHYSVYAITHLVYALNDYGRFRLSPRWLPFEFEFLKTNMDAVIEMDELDMVGEFLDTLKAFGLDDHHPLLRRGTRYLLSSQNPDGSWGDPHVKDPCLRYHTTLTAIDGLRDYAWRGEGLSFPGLMPFLKICASRSRSGIDPVPD